MRHRYLFSVLLLLIILGLPLGFADSDETKDCSPQAGNCGDNSQTTRYVENDNGKYYLYLDENQRDSGVGVTSANSPEEFVAKIYNDKEENNDLSSVDIQYGENTEDVQRYVSALEERKIGDVEVSDEERQDITLDLYTSVQESPQYASAISENADDTFRQDLDNYRQGNWDELSNEELQDYSGNNIRVEDLSPIQEQMDELDQRIENNDGDADQLESRRSAYEGSLRQVIRNNPSEVMASGAMSVEDFENYANEECEGTFNCLFHSETNANQLVLEDVNNQIDQARTKALNEGLKPSSPEFNERVREASIDTAARTLLNSGGELPEQTRNRLEECSNNDGEACSLNDITQARSELDCSDAGDSQDCRSKSANAEQIANMGRERQNTQVGIGQTLLTGLLKPDQNALKAAELFGFEANYSNLPQYLGESIPSQLCMAKIEGYLDKEVQDQGGVTVYNDNPRNLQVQADLRAQRTRVTPNLKTSISYSYFFRAEEDLSYIVAVAYEADGEIHKAKISGNDTSVGQVKKGNTKKGFEHVSFPVNASSPDEVNEQSFRIGLIAVDKNRNVEYLTTAPIVLISSGDSKVSPGGSVSNNAGHNTALQQDHANQEGGNPLTAQDLLGLMN